MSPLVVKGMEDEAASATTGVATTYAVVESDKVGTTEVRGEESILALLKTIESLSNLYQ